MDSQIWRQSHNRRFHSESQVDLTLRLGFPNGNGGELKHSSQLGQPDSGDHNKPCSTALHNINHHARQTHQVMMNNNHGLESCGGRSNGQISEASYNPHQILWSKELKTYVLKSNNFGQLHQSSFSHQVKGVGSTENNLANNLSLQKNNDDLYALLNPASRITDDPEAEASSGCRRRGSRRRRGVSNCNDGSEKRCTNYNCNTNFTPMWRKGPLGPKSLCNACGIRYRKETMNREAMAAENSHS